MNSNDDWEELGPELARWLRERPEEWPYLDGQSMNDSDMDRIVTAIVEGHRRPARRRRRLLAGAAVGAVTLGGGAIGVAALLHGGQPSRPESGIACRAEATDQADAVVLAPGADPILGCRQLWESGAFGDRVTPTVLSACIDPRGVINVVPGTSEVCDTLGFAIADSVPSDTNQMITELHQQLVDELNSGPCRDVSDVAEAAAAMLDETGLDDWEVRVEPGSEGGACGKVAVVAPERTVVVHTL